jgi:glycosyltransferase involved in cell wall biosynthesis
MSKLGYLCGSPRVSTRPEAGEYGPYTHVIGTIEAFQSLGWEVEPYLVGDKVPSSWVGQSAAAFRKSHVSRLASDAIRIGLNSLYMNSAWSRLGNQVTWVYERFGAFQNFGRPFMKHGIPWILEVNSLFSLEGQFEPEVRSVEMLGLARYLEFRAFHDCHVLVTSTEAMKKILVSHYKLPVSKILVVPSAVDARRFEPNVSTVRVFKNFTIGYVGSLRPWQGIDVLLYAMAQLGKDGVDCSLVVVGDGPTRDELQTLANRLGLAEQVYFKGAIRAADVPAWIAGIDIGYSGQVNTNILESMYFSPLKLYEYMAMAKPVIASTHEDSLRLVMPGKTGYLFQGGSVDDLTNALRKAFRGREHLREMGLQARDLILKGHTWQIRTENMIDEITDRLSSKI